MQYAESKFALTILLLYNVWMKIKIWFVQTQSNLFFDGLLSDELIE